MTAKEGKQIYDTVVKNKVINKEQIFGIKDKQVIYIPSFEELCLNAQPVSQIIDLDENDVIKLFDIRAYYHFDFCELDYINPQYQVFYNKMKNTYPNADSILVDLFKLSIEAEKDAVTFFKTLSDKEKNALFEIKKNLMYNNEGIIQLLRISKETEIPRNVYTSLLTKMNTMQIAETQSFGAKGTYIKIINTKIWEVENENE